MPDRTASESGARAARIRGKQLISGRPPVDHDLVHPALQFCTRGHLQHLPQVAQQRVQAVRDVEPCRCRAERDELRLEAHGERAPLAATLARCAGAAAFLLVAAEVVPAAARENVARVGALPHLRQRPLGCTLAAVEAEGGTHGCTRLERKSRRTALATDASHDYSLYKTQQLYTGPSSGLQ